MKKRTWNTLFLFGAFGVAAYVLYKLIKNKAAQDSLSNYTGTQPVYIGLGGGNSYPLRSTMPITSNKQTPVDKVVLPQVGPTQT